MTRVLALSNQKGGVAKTTSAINIAAALARVGQRVVLVDLDPQANLTSGLGLGDAEQNVYGALLGEYRLKAYATETENLVVVAGSPGFSGFEQLKGQEPNRDFLLRDLLAPLHSRCDFIVLDCPPALGLITVNAYACAHEVYIPTEAQLYGLDGLTKVVDLVERMRQHLNPGLKVGGIFFTRYDKRKVLRRETADLVRSHYPDLVLASVIRESIALSEAPHASQDIFSYASNSAGSSDYQELAMEILSR
jgi:chromosome partitioning protein